MRRTAVAVVSWGSRRLDIFGLAQRDDEVRHKAWANGAWWPEPMGWQGLGRGVFKSPITVESWGSDRLDIFGVGSIRNQPFPIQMLHKAWANGEWHPSPGWERLGGSFNSPPAVASWGPNRLDIFALGRDDQMFHKAWAEGRWHPSPTTWEPLGGLFNSPPAVASWGPNRLDIFALGRDDQMFHKAWAEGRWHPSPTTWEPLGGLFNSPPAVASWGPNRLDIFALGRANQMLHKAWAEGRWHPSPTTWEPLGGPFALP
jgi:hypothetical protein